jgi:hypothetical protein
MIPFLILTCVFLISCTLLKNQTGAHLLDRRLGVHCQNSIQHTLLVNPFALAWVHAKLEWVRTTSFVHVRDINPKF